MLEVSSYRTNSKDRKPKSNGSDDMAAKNKRALSHSLQDFIRTVARDLEAASKMLKNHPHLITETSSIGETALHYLVIENHLKGADFLIRQGAEVNTQEMSGNTPLHHAAQLGYEEMCLLLIENGAHVDACNADQETPLHLAAAAGRVNIVEALIKAGSDVRVRNDLGETILD